MLQKIFSNRYLLVSNLTSKTIKAMTSLRKDIMALNYNIYNYPHREESLSMNEVCIHDIKRTERKLMAIMPLTQILLILLVQKNQQ